MNYFSSFIGTFVILGCSNLAAQEAWLIEMPKKFGGYLLSKYQAGENDTVQEIIGKLPILVTKKTIKEIESIKLGAPGKNFQTKSRYNSMSAADKTQRNLTIQTPAGENNYTITSYGELGKSWTPSAVLIKGDQYLFLLERDESSSKETVSTPNNRKFSYKAGDSGEFIWYSSTPLDGKTLTFREGLTLKTEGRPAPVQYGINITSLLKKDSQSSVQVEVSSKDSSDASVIVLHHTQALFPNLSKLTGPLKKEVISLNSTDVKDVGEDGSWTLTIEGK